MVTEVYNLIYTTHPDPDTGSHFTRVTSTCRYPSGHVLQHPVTYSGRSADYNKHYTHHHPDATWPTLVPPGGK